MYQVSEGVFWGVVLLLLVVLAVCGLWAKTIYQQREQARLQDQVRNLLFEYIPLESGEYEMESISQSSITKGGTRVQPQVKDRGGPHYAQAQRIV